MSKKRKSSRRKKSEEPAMQSGAWQFLFIFLLFAFFALILIGNFGVGGPLPTWLGKHAVQGTVGGAGYVVPFALLLWAYHKIRDVERKMPRWKFWSMVLAIFSLASLLRVLGDSVNDLGEHTGTGGGVIGRALGGAVVGILDKIPASILWFLLFMLFFSVTVGLRLSHYLDLIRSLFKHRERSNESEDLGELKGRAAGFRMTAGVPVEHIEEPLTSKAKPSMSMKNTGQKLQQSEDHAALTVASDPNWQFPSIKLLNEKQDKADPGNVETNAQIIEETFANFNIDVEMEGANVGPRVTQFTLKPPAGIKLQKITALESNLALDLAAQSIRMEAPIPGKRAVGIEVPNVKSAIVRVSSVMQSSEWKTIKSPLGFVIGKDITGAPVVGALDKMPHLLVAGQTGSGKSVMINTILSSLLFHNSPSDLKLILVDPKQVELTPYNDVPHLLTPVITEPEKCISALKWAVAEMERRLRTMAEVSKRNIGEYNELKQEAGMPYIVIVIDELADLMMMAARDVESLIVRLAQKARATGIHLILATQRPSVDVITGLIKANVPARIAFTVASQVDSRTIIDQVGAEKLLGMGDMLLSTSDMPKPKRVQGAFIDEPEVAALCDFIRMQRPPDYNPEIISQPVQIGKGSNVMDMGGSGSGDEDMFKDAVLCVIEAKKASTSLLQRRLRIGYGRAARMIEQMEEQGIVGPPDGSRPRDVLVSSMDEVFGVPSQGGPGGQGDVYDDMPNEG